MKYRMRFSKEGMVKFIGHLDIMRYFQKAFRRAGLDLSYSQGFSPHPLLSFASPLGVGLESEGEYLDIELNSRGSIPEMTDAVNAQMTEGIRIISIIELPDDAKPSMALIAAADYDVRFREGMQPWDDTRKGTEVLADAVRRFMDRKEIIVRKKTKKSESLTDIRPLIYDMYATDEGSLRMQVAAGSAKNIKPQLIMNEMYNNEGWEADEFAWQITRLDIYTDTGSDSEGRQLVSLSQYRG